MKELRNLYMNIYGDTLRKIIMDLDVQLDDAIDNDTSVEDVKFLTDSIKLAIDIYIEYTTVSDEMGKLTKKYL